MEEAPSYNRVHTRLPANSANKILLTKEQKQQKIQSMHTAAARYVRNAGSDTDRRDKNKHRLLTKR